MKTLNKTPMKQFVESMQNVSFNEFTIDGKTWRTVIRPNGRPDIGSSPNGIWNYMTNGDECRTVYKKDVAKYDVEKALKLFHEN